MGVGFAAGVAAAAGAGHGGETAVVGAHEPVKWNGGDGGKDRLVVTFDAAAEGLRDDAGVVEADVHDEGQTHQVEFAHVFVFVLVNAAKPAAVAVGKSAIVPDDEVGDWLAFLLGEDEAEGGEGGEGDPIQTGTV